MAEIVISEFMDQSSVDETAKKYEVLYDPELVGRPDELHLQLQKLTNKSNI